MYDCVSGGSQGVFGNSEGGVNATCPVLDISRLMNERNEQRLELLAVRYARVALGISFLSAVADRFGLWGKYSSWGNFANFEHYTAKVNSFMPAFSIPFLAWASTIAEIALGVALIAGIWPRWVSLCSAVLLALFGLAMAWSLGIKEPLAYSVFSASACAALLAISNARRLSASR
jgi:uncharacterized membrane protein YphA (DoxX/SURF4 family)